MLVGIDKAAFHTSHYAIDLNTLAIARGVDPDKYKIGLGQERMAVSPPDEDIVTLAANAANTVLENEDLSNISTLLFATESSIDQSKAAGIFVHHLLKLPKTCRCIELKQACYSATAGLQMAMGMLMQNPEQKILLIAADIARYGLNTSGESSQGGGAVAMLLTANPRLVALEPHSGFCTEDVMDFWRPNYRDEALVEGKYSCEIYLRLLKETWQTYSERSGNQYDDIDYFCYHTPLPRLAEKGHQKLSMINGQGKPKNLREKMGGGLDYSRTIGNCYSASLYLGLISLLENTPTNLSGKRIGLYSYGSGAVAEYFSVIVQPNYQEALFTEQHQTLIAARKLLLATEYERFYSFNYPTDGSQLIVPKHSTGSFRLAKLENHKRYYEACTKAKARPAQTDNVVAFA